MKKMTKAAKGGKKVTSATTGRRLGGRTTEKAAGWTRTVRGKATRRSN